MKASSEALWRSENLAHDLAARLGIATELALDEHRQARRRDHESVDRASGRVQFGAKSAPWPGGGAQRFPVDLPCCYRMILTRMRQITTKRSRSLRCRFIALSSSECRWAHPVGFGRCCGPPTAPSLF